MRRVVDKPFGFLIAEDMTGGQGDHIHRKARHHIGQVRVLPDHHREAKNVLEPRVAARREGGDAMHQVSALREAEESIVGAAGARCVAQLARDRLQRFVEPEDRHVFEVLQREVLEREGACVVAAHHPDRRTPPPGRRRPGRQRCAVPPASSLRSPGWRAR